jgi:periplasmic protein TonB
MKLISSLFFLFCICQGQAQTDTTLYGWIDSTTYREVEVTAPFAGGRSVWEAYLKKQLKYPKAAKENKIQGTVVIEFTIHINSTVSDLKVFKSVEKSLDEEALRLIRNGVWVPAIQNGRQVNYRARREIEFRLK